MQIVGLLIAAVVSLGAALVALRRGGSAARLLGLLMLAIAEWEVMSALGAVAVDVPGKVLWAKLQYVAICSVAPLWLLFCASHARSLTPRLRHVALLFALPLLILGLAITNESHHLIWSSVDIVVDGGTMRGRFHYGPAFWVAATYNYALLATGSAMLISAQLRRGDRFRGQTLALMLGVAIPWLANAAYLTQRVPMDITSIGFTLSSLLCAWSLFDLRLVDLLPIARDITFVNIPDGALVLDRRGRIVDANPAAEALLGSPVRTLPGGRPEAWLQAAVEDRHLVRLTGVDGVVRTCAVGRQPIRSARGTPLGELVLLRDETERLEVEAELVAERNFARQVMDAMGQGLFVTDGHGNLEYANATLARMLGTTPTELRGRAAASLVVDEDRDQVQLHRAERRAGSRTEHQARLLCATGEPLHVLLTHVPRFREAVFAGWIVVVTDLTVRREFEAALAHRAHHDPLTDLPNRVLLQTRLSQALAASKRGSSVVAVLLLDLDRFKQANDALGHRAGDTLLQQISARWRALLRDQDTLARLGGDEFALVVPGLVDADAVAPIAERLVRATDAPFVLDGTPVHVGVSIGVALVPWDGEDPETLLRRADQAMYRAKGRGGGWVLFSQSLMDLSRSA